METMLARENEEMVRKNADLAKVARTSWVYINMCIVGFFLLHLLHLL